LSWEPELFSVLGPTERQAAGQSFKSQIRRLTSVEDGFNNVRGEKSALQNSAHLMLVHAELLGKGSLTGDFSGEYPFVPGA
jgi:hypothetical protein